jgi:quercetin dioxygenase-like cupin family protein
MPGRFIAREDVERISRIPGRDAAVLSGPRETGSEEIILVHARSGPGSGHDFHLHPRQEEVVYVLVGELEAWIGHELRILRSGDVMYVPRGVAHATFTVGEETAEMIVVASPCCDTETGIETVELAHEEPWASVRRGASRRTRP